MNRETRIRISKFIALILRHKPEKAGIELDEHGYADTKELIRALNQRYSFSMEDLEEIVRTDDKQRYAFNEDHTKIRASQGHSVAVDVELTKAEPPEFLYHGTAERFVQSIRETGIRSQNRLYVHLSKDVPTAVSVGQRHGKPAVFRIRAKDMWNDGYPFYLSANRIWLSDHIPSEYLEQIQ